MKTVEEIFALAIALPDDDVKRLFSLLGAFIFSSDMSESETKSGSDLVCVEESQAVAEANGSADDCVRDSVPVEGKPSDLMRVSANTADESTDTFSDAESVAEMLVRPGNRANLEKTTIKARFKDGRVCPFCGSNKLSTSDESLIAARAVLAVMLLRWKRIGDDITKASGML